MDDETGKWINLLVSAPDFTIKIDSETGLGKVLRLSKIPDNDGIYWLKGTSKLANSREVDSVLILDTDAGGEPLEVFWNIDGRWYPSGDTSALDALGANPDAVFPFDWATNVPLTRDIFHDHGV